MAITASIIVSALIGAAASAASLGISLGVSEAQMNRSLAASMGSEFRSYAYSEQLYERQVADNQAQIAQAPAQAVEQNNAIRTDTIRRTYGASGRK